MSVEITYCPGTLKEGFDTYSPLALKKMFGGRKVSHLLPYKSPASNLIAEELFKENQKRMSISGVQEKFSVLLDKNKLRLITEGEQGEYILKPIPNVGKKSNQMPANEHVTMQIASQVFDIETANNALVFFEDGTPAYLTKRFDVKKDGSKWAQEDFASLAQRSPQTHGSDFKYLGSYLEIFEVLKRYVPAYTIEAIKLFKLILFNFLFSNGDAHFKNFSLIETPLGDFKLSPAYDLLNSRIHIADQDFALHYGLLPPNKAKGKIIKQFYILGNLAGLPKKQVDKVFHNLTSNQDDVLALVTASYLDEKTKREYIQGYQTRLKKITR